MARYTSWNQVFAIVILALFVTCVPAHAQQFSPTINVSNNSDYSFTPQVAADSSGTIYMAWEDDTANNSNILFSRSTDGGVTFSAPINLSNTAGYSFAPRITTGTAGNVYVTWQDSTPGNTVIMFSHSADSGVTFAANVNISNGSADSSSQQIAVDAAGNIFVVWENDTANLGVFFSRSTDGGATFSAPVALSTNTSGSMSPQMAIGLNGNLSAVWEDDANAASDISFSYSSDHGASFSVPESLSLHTGNSTSAQIATDLSGNIDVIWENDSRGNPEVFFSRSAGNGATFSPPTDISNGSGTAQNGLVGLDAQGNINVVWADGAAPGANPDIYFARSANGGATFSSPLNISNNAGASENPFFTIDAAANLDVAWEDNTPGNQQVFFSHSTDSGATFSAPLNLSNDSGLSLAANMAADSKGNLNVTWQDATPGISQIFFSRLAGTVVANQPPVANAGTDQTIACSGPNGASATLNGSQSSDPDGDALSFVWTDDAGNVVGNTAIVQVTVGLGTHTFTLTVTDSAGLSSKATTHVTVGDTTPPTLQLTLSPNVLWPPNHQLIPITASVTASDSCDANPAVTLVSITSNEPDNGLGDGDQPNDIQAIGGGPVAFGTDVRSFLLRAERSGMGNGRVYTVTYTAKDAAGNSASASAQVIVSNGGSTIANTSSTLGGPVRRKREGKDKDRDNDRGHDPH